MKYTVITPLQSITFNSMTEALEYINSNNIINFKLIRK